MKKIVYMFAAVLLFASCAKEEIGGTATEALAGQWYVHVDAVDENGDVVYTGAEMFGLENFMLLTYNTSVNNEDVMFVDDLENFWTFKAKVDCSTSSLTFSITDEKKYVCATAYDGSGDLETYNNYYYKAGNFDAEKWAWYKEGEKQFKAGLIKKDSLDKMLTEYYDYVKSLPEYFGHAVDTVSSGYFVKCLGRDFEVGQVLADYDDEGNEIFDDDVENACNTFITDGKILKGAATTPSGMPADSIVFNVEFDDDPYPGAYGYKNYRVSGYRYTGFSNDD